MNSQEKIEKAIEKGWKPIGSNDRYTASPTMYFYHEEREEVAKLTVQTNEIPELTFEEEEDNVDKSTGFL